LTDIVPPVPVANAVQKRIEKTKFPLV